MLIKKKVLEKSLLQIMAKQVNFLSKAISKSGMKNKFTQRVIKKEFLIF